MSLQQTTMFTKQKYVSNQINLIEFDKWPPNRMSRLATGRSNTCPVHVGTKHVLCSHTKSRAYGRFEKQVTSHISIKTNVRTTRHFPAAALQHVCKQKGFRAYDTNRRDTMMVSAAKSF